MLMKKLEIISKNIDYTQQDNINDLMKLLNNNRYIHTLSVVKTIKKICLINNLDEKITKKALLAGFYHDFAKGYLSIEEMNLYNEKYNVISNLEYPIEAYHGHIASDILQRFLNIHDSMIIDAINNHTILENDLSIICKILFIADYSEPTRKFVNDEVLKNYNNIDKAFNIIIKEKYLFLKKNNIEISKGLKEKYEVIKMSDLKVIINALEEKLANDIVVIDMHGVSPIFDYNVICHGTSQRQIEAIAKEVKDQANIHGIEISHVEGINSKKWILVDLKDIIIHIFEENERSVYQIEKLLGELPRIPLEEIE